MTTAIPARARAPVIRRAGAAAFLRPGNPVAELPELVAVVDERDPAEVPLPLDPPLPLELPPSMMKGPIL